MEHLEEGDEQHEDDDSERLPQRLQGNVLLLLPAQGFPENYRAISCFLPHGMETTFVDKFPKFKRQPLV